MTQPASLLRPETDESLASFLRRVQTARGIRNERLAALLLAVDGSKKESSWLRQVKAWRSNSPLAPATVNEANARSLGDALGADFMPFLFDPTDRGWRDLVLQIQAGLQNLDQRVTELEARL